MDRFPDYADHVEVTCYNCKVGLPKTKPEKTRFSIGTWRKLCRKCKVYTYYDLKPRKSDA